MKKIKSNPRKKKALLIYLFLFLLLLLFIYYRQYGYLKQRISRMTHINVSFGSVLSSMETHGGFFGDGNTYLALQFSNDHLENEIKQNPNWHQLQLTPSLAIFLGLYDDSSMGSSITDEDGKPLFPHIKNGYYFFQDRSSQSTDIYDDSHAWDPIPHNFTLAIYDSDTEIFYFYERDT